MQISLLIKKIRNKNYAVFLDAKTPAFVGDKALFGLNINYDKKMVF